MAERILGIDPGLNITGYGVIERVAAAPPTLVEAGVIRSIASHTLERRVQAIYEGVADVIGSLKPSVVAIEELYSHYERPKTAILMAHARGVIYLAAAGADLEVVSYPSTNVKKLITGAGRAPKLQVQQSIQRELALPNLPEPPDVADALAIAMCHYYVGNKRKIA